MSVPEVDPEAARALAESGALLLDVREPNEWNAGHAPHALFIPLGQLAEHVDELPRDRRIVAICRVGGRSARATEFLIAAGVDAVNLAGGMRAWAASGLDVETDDGDAGTVI